MTLDSEKVGDGASITTTFAQQNSDAWDGRPISFAQSEAPWGGYNEIDNPSAVAPPVLPWEKMTLSDAAVMETGTLGLAQQGSQEWDE